MLSWIVLIVVLIAFIVIGTWLWGSIFGPGTVMDPPDEPQKVLENNRVAAAQGRFDDVQFEVVPRGYRQDQVDDLLAQLGGGALPAQVEIFGVAQLPPAVLFHAAIAPA